MIRIQNITKSFDGNKVLDDITFDLSNTGTLAIVGRSGIGKTTLLRIIAGLETADDGIVEIDDAKIAYKFQEPRLFPWMTAVENVSAVTETAEDAMDLLAKVELTHAADLYPDQLSGGMQQRVALARALAYHADVLLLDEPFSAVDEETKALLLSLVKQYAETHAVIIVSHDQSEIDALGASVLTLL